MEVRPPTGRFPEELPETPKYDIFGPPKLKELPIESEIDKPLSQETKQKIFKACPVVSTIFKDPKTAPEKIQQLCSLLLKPARECGKNREEMHG